MTTLERFQRWYASQCNGNWEHSYGVKVSTLDNPGWSVEIDLKETEMANQTFAKVEHGLLDETDDWHVCSVKDFRFQGFGDPSKLETILEIFLNWADGARK